MQIITAQHHVSMPIVRKKLGRNHRVALNLLCPWIGIVVDGHHDYYASLIDHKEVRYVVTDLHHSDGKCSADLLDHWALKCDRLGRLEAETTWDKCFYELHTGRYLTVKELNTILEAYPDYRYTV